MYRLYGQSVRSGLKNSIFRFESRILNCSKFLNGRDKAAPDEIRISRPLNPGQILNLRGPYLVIFHEQGSYLHPKVAEITKKFTREYDCVIFDQNVADFCQ